MREDWIEVELGDVANFIGGGTPSKANPDYWNGNLPWASVKDIKGFFLNSTGDSISEVGLKNSAANVAEVGELIVATRIIPGRPIFSRIRTAINQDLKIVRSKIPIDTMFLLYSLLNAEKNVVKESSGTTVLGIRLEVLRTIKIPLAPLPEQRAIVSKIQQLFSALDNGTANLKKAQAQLKVYRQAVLKKAFEGELTREWRETQTNLPNADELSKIIEEERAAYYQYQIGEWNYAISGWEKSGKDDKKPTKPRPPEIPESPNEEHLERTWNLPSNWIWSQLGLIAFVTKLAGFEYTDYVTYDDEGELSVIKAENAGPNGFKTTAYSKIKAESVAHLTRSHLKGGELLVVFVGAGTGQVAVVPSTQRFFLGPNIGMARPYFDVESKYLEYYFQSPTGKNLLLATMKAVAQPSLSMGTIRQTPIVFMSEKEQHQIVQEIESRLSVCDKLEESIKESLQKSEALRQSILKRAFAGQLLTEDELAACRQEKDWENAGVLLERVRKEKTETKKMKANV